ncbi:hypothetical protein [Clostridium septicum]|uniref:Uncharacterized protein n=1 Tax=Clostridium septicum TaxID=1504 RepID=A0A9N7PMP7_CLOSE|nr:hypothetical protein [Clostridium septicum]AYE35417.1 hypothetical protein CP523_13805 [Clostridium septicum]MDU1315279.1 hypothetical protein [Clostridium septicum]QAS60805.1 hypothetical protein EI377_08700 [Clostridium septicum]UEC19929.1 hypothetical protein LK444_10970 [Clostridium septicum]USS02011.1 hypothetical protein NH397_06195 [Clostridium septicum]
MIDINEFDEIIKFKSNKEKISKLKQWSILTESAKDIKKLIYRGTYTDTSIECDVIGYIEKFTNNKCIDIVYDTAIIKIGENILKISPMYLKDMQESDIKINDLQFNYKMLKKYDSTYLECYFNNNSDYNIIAITLDIHLSNSNQTITLNNSKITYKKSVSSTFSTPIPSIENINTITVLQCTIKYKSGNVVCNTIYNSKSKRYTIY